MLKYSNVTVRLGPKNGPDGNAFAVLASVKKALRAHGVDELEIAQYVKEATSGDYENLLRVTREWVSFGFRGER